jgi:hypothetical protein
MASQRKRWPECAADGVAWRLAPQFGPAPDGAGAEGGGATQASDRFAPPKASFAYSKSGTAAFALGGRDGRPLTRVQGAAFERGKADAAAAAARAPPPGGRRMAPGGAYLEAAAARTARAERAAAAAAARGLHTAHGARVRASSPEVAGALAWRDAAAARAGGGARPATAPAPAARLGPVDSWDPWRQAPFPSASPRFAQHAAADGAAAAGALAAAAAATARAASRAARHADAAAAGAAAAAAVAGLEGRWPHGAPEARVREARARGVALGRLGYGSVGAMNEAHFRAVRSAMKRP